MDFVGHSPPFDRKTKTLLFLKHSVSVLQACRIKCYRSSLGTVLVLGVLSDLTADAKLIFRDRFFMPAVKCFREAVRYKINGS